MVRTVAITLLRHGLTKANEEQRYIGWTDIPLSIKGRNMLDRTGFYPHADVFITSDLKRCVETLRILYNKSYILSPWFREMNFGDWEHKTYEQLKEDSVYCKWLDSYQQSAPTNGESYQQFTDRVQQGWKSMINELEKQKASHVVVMTHGGVIRLLLEVFAPEERAFWEWSVPFGGGYTLITTEDRLRRGERCISLQAVPFRESETGLSSNTI
ncbi:histidine phosphatase family protein [Bacillus sp. 165]|uniref:histidine phosphatase family protein n=1 Tax=Bacillus sp. 165 TaxID=1529117 RepID=UPI001ADA7172|nr:histidine phosphatase family protein [Bacillus sp. 165]MBO9128284.1 histidine phosphatase family protein [Bacillus sp. 165]